ncbi:hypothetical protein LINGRAHAP2_LOCUS29583 [Linum grandiflorum]
MDVEDPAPTASPPKHDEDVGEWMIGGRFRHQRTQQRAPAPRPPSPAPSASLPKKGVSSSRFAALSEQGNELTNNKETKATVSCVEPRKKQQPKSSAIKAAPGSNIDATIGAKKSGAKDSAPTCKPSSEPTSGVNLRPDTVKKRGHPRKGSSLISTKTTLSPQFGTGWQGGFGSVPPSSFHLADSSTNITILQRGAPLPGGFSTSAN